MWIHAIREAISLGSEFLCNGEPGCEAVSEEGVEVLLLLLLLCSWWCGCANEKIPHVSIRARGERANLYNMVGGVGGESTVLSTYLGRSSMIPPMSVDLDWQSSVHQSLSCHCLGSNVCLLELSYVG